MMTILYLFFYLFYTSAALEDHENSTEKYQRDYVGCKVITALPRNQDDVDLIVEIKDMYEDCDLDWWNEPSQPGVAVSVLVPPACQENIANNLTVAGLSYNVTVGDLQQLINEEKRYRFIVMDQKDGYNGWMNVYHNLAEIRERIDWLVSTHSHLITKTNLATTYEGRSIDVLIVKQQNSKVKPAIWLDCGIHAREWVSPPACLQAIQELVQGVNAVDPSENLLTMYDFYILPVTNPDGYVYSWEYDRMWRKNRRPLTSSSKNPSGGNGGWNDVEVVGGGGGGNGGWNNGGYPGVGGGYPGVGGGYPGVGGGYPGGVGGGYPGYPKTYQNLKAKSRAKCTHGVDPNRNFPAKFEKNTARECDDSFKGASPFSEAESQAVRKGVQMMRNNNGQIAAFVSIHAYSQYWMSPYGYSYNKPSDYNDHMRVMKKSVEALRSHSGTSFKYGPISDIIYVAYGSSVDWAYDGGIKYSFGLELRDTGRRGFLLPQDQIEATVQETWVGLKKMALVIAPEFGITI